MSGTPSLWGEQGNGHIDMHGCGFAVWSSSAQGRSGSGMHVYLQVIGDMVQYPNKMTFDIMEGGGVPPPPVGLLQIKASPHTQDHLHHYLQHVFMPHIYMHRTCTCP